MPEMTVRSSTRGLPGLPRGRCGLSAFHASSDSQNKLLAMTIASCDSNQAQIYNQNQQTVWVPYLGSGLIDHSQKTRAAAMLRLEPDPRHPGALSNEPRRHWRTFAQHRTAGGVEPRRR